MAVRSGGAPAAQVRPSGGASTPKGAGVPMMVSLREAVADPGAVMSTMVATAHFRLRGVDTAGLVLCRGRPPILFTRGAVTMGRGVVFRGLMMRSEFGA